MWCFSKKKKPTHDLVMGRRIAIMNVICSLGHCEFDSHTVHKLSQRLPTADWLNSQESDCSRKHSRVSCDWLPSYNKATQTVLEIFKMAGYLPDSLLADCKPRILKVADYVLILVKIIQRGPFLEVASLLPTVIVLTLAVWVLDRRTLGRISKSYVNATQLFGHKSVFYCN